MYVNAIVVKGAAKWNARRVPRVGWGISEFAFAARQKRQQRQRGNFVVGFWNREIVGSLGFLHPLRHMLVPVYENYSYLKICGFSVKRRTRSASLLDYFLDICFTNEEKHVKYPQRKYGTRGLWCNIYTKHWVAVLCRDRHWIRLAAKFLWLLAK